MPVKQEADIRTIVGSNFAAVHAGPFAELSNYRLHVPKLDRTVSGKLFLKEYLALTGMEISLNKLPAGVSIPFYHQHKANEEVYIFTGGQGQIQIDGQTVDVQEGSVVRIGTNGNRAIRNNSSRDLYFICIQAKQDSLESETIDDGIASDSPVSWPN